MVRRTKNQTGFTIVELMIATLVFSMVLILITVGVLSFTKAYYKGVNQSNTQNTARQIIENVAQAIQFSGDKVTTNLGTTGSNGSKGFCIGNQRYSYIEGWQLTDGTPDTSVSQTKHVLLRDSPGTCSGLPAQDVRDNNANGTELLQPNMRIAKLSVAQVGSDGLYRVTVRVVYGDDDLLYSPSNNSAGPKAQDATCRASISGSQYCAQAELSTVVKKRIMPTE